MKAVVLFGKREVRVADFPIREVGPRDVKVEVKYCGICGTDFHKVMGKSGSRPVKYPVPLGHEISGYVKEIGAEVKGLSVGDPVTVDPNYSCGACYYCKEGKSWLCSNSMGVVKGMAEYVVAPYENVYKLPEQMDLRAAALCEPLACCIHGMDLLDVRQGENVALVGLGSIGVMMLQLLRLAGAGRILVIEPRAEKKELALSLGATDFLTPDDEEGLLAAKENGHYSKIMECVGNSAAQTVALKVADRGATVVLFGVSNPEDRLSVDVYDLFLRELTLKTSYINPHTTGRAIELLASERLDTDAILAAELSMEEAVEELLTPDLSKKGKVLVRIEA